MVDLCTGSGAIAKAVADEVPQARVHAVELDEPALPLGRSATSPAPASTCARATSATAFDDLAGTVDVVVCNPPYIPLEAWESVAPEARDHDPHLALFSGDDGLDAIRVLAVRAAAAAPARGSARRRARRRPGRVGAGGASTATGRWTEVRDHRDLAGRPRFTDRPTGTMSPCMSTRYPTTHRRGARGRRRGGQPGHPARRPRGAADGHRLRPGRRRLRQGLPSRSCSTPRAAAARCRRRCWSRPRPPSTRWRSGSRRGRARWSRSSGPGALTLVCHAQQPRCSGTSATPAARSRCGCPTTRSPWRSSSAPARSRSARPT